MPSPLTLALAISLAFSAVSGSTKIPDFTLDDLAGNTVKFSELQGDSLTVIDFWATWCGPCLSSLPDLARLSQEFEGTTVKFVGINVDSPRNVAKVKPFAKAMGIPYPVLLDLNSEVMGLLNVVAMPTLLVVDSDREIVWMHEGYRPGDDEVIRKQVHRLLSE